MSAEEQTKAEREFHVGDGALATGDGAVAVGKGGIYVDGGVGGDVLGAGATKISLPVCQTLQPSSEPMRSWAACWVWERTRAAR